MWDIAFRNVPQRAGEETAALLKTKMRLSCFGSSGFQTEAGSNGRYSKYNLKETQGGITESYSGLGGKGP